MTRATAFEGAKIWRKLVQSRESTRDAWVPNLIQETITSHGVFNPTSTSVFGGSNGNLLALDRSAMRETLFMAIHAHICVDRHLSRLVSLILQFPDLKNAYKEHT